MNRKNSKFSVKNLVLGALFLALALVLPFFTGQIPQIGAMLCPMHLPILLAGFVCGGPVGAVVGFIAPLLRMVMFGMPPFYVAIAMAFELLTYGLVSGIMYRKVFKKQTVGTLYGSLLIAMVAGRIVWGIVKVILSGIAADAGAFTFVHLRRTFKRNPGHRGAAYSGPGRRFCLAESKADRSTERGKSVSTVGSLKGRHCRLFFMHKACTHLAIVL